MKPDNHLYMVLTVSEVCKLWKRNRGTVYYHIDHGHFVAREAGTNWLIDAQSVVDTWGMPDMPARYLTLQRYNWFRIRDIVV